MLVKAFPDFEKGDPRFYLSKNKIPGSPTFVFVHFYGGNQRVLKRHIELINQLGYDAFAYNMPSHEEFFKMNFLRKWLYRDGRFGMKHFFGRMLGFYLDQIPGQKIIFAFSNPSAAAIEAIYDRTQKENHDVIGLVCDSGPSHAFLQSAWRLTVELGHRYHLLFFFSFFWSLLLHKDIRCQLKKFPLGFKILSIQGALDRIITPNWISDVFQKCGDRVQVDVAVFAMSGHLTSFKQEPEKYRDVMTNWLKKFA